MTMALLLIVAATLSVIWCWLEFTNPLPTPNAAPVSDLDPQAPACATIGHRMVLSDLRTWWYCGNDGCNEMWPADDTHHIDLPYDREAVRLVDEIDAYLEQAS